jgi:uncharacterized membrane protein
MAQEIVYERGLEDAKQFARVLYIAHAVTFFFSFGLLSILVLIVNYIRRPETACTIVYTHHTWMIRSFCFYVLWMALAWLIWGVAWIWKAYRLIKGLLDLNDNKPMPI